jgi:hypothetical protein
MGEEDALHILPPYVELRKSLQSAAPCVEDQFLVTGLH